MTDDPNRLRRSGIMTDEEREEIAAAKLGDALTLDETQLLFDALGFWSSDDNDAPHDAIAAMRERLKRVGATCIGGNERP